MSRIAPIAVFAFALLAAGCARLESLGPSAFAPASEPETTASVTPTEQFASETILLFLDPTAVEAMSEKEKLEAASAQYYALQFGRPGTPRMWQGDVSASGEVTVGPFVRVNALDCRDFSHLVKIGETSYPRSGTACREAGGEWVVVASTQG